MKTEAISPQTLVAILIAARKHGNRELERDMRQKLEEQYAVKLRFCKEGSVAR